MKQVSILDYGAKADGSPCTAAIQRAIDDCFLSGGGTVEIPEGKFLTGGIRLRSNITLLLRSGACLTGSRNPEDYLTFLDDPLEPLPEDMRCGMLWRRTMDFQNQEWMRKPGSRWGNGLIRAIGAEHVRIIGEEGAVIDGSDCFDAIGEENYRGPHGISMHGCQDVKLQGYTIQNTGNWAHALFDCRDISMDHVTCLAGHDGIHVTGCDRIQVENCAFYTGDDCVAGIDNTELSVTRCTLNSSCSAFRLGGRHIRIRRCHIYGPGKYVFRGSLSLAEKQAGTPSGSAQDHRYNMLSAFTYYADYSWNIRHQPGDIRMEDCEITGADRFVHYNFSGNETWQRNRPLEDITFRNLTVKELRMPLILYGDQDIPVTCEISNCEFSFEPSIQRVPFLHLCNYKQILLEHLQIQGLDQAPLIKRWSNAGDLVLRDVVYTNSSNPRVEEADEVFQCVPI